MNVRPPQRADLVEVLELARAADIALIGDTDWTEDDLRAEWDELDLGRNAWIFERDGRIGGYASFDDRGEGRLIVDGYVDPALQGEGIGTEILRVTEARAWEEVSSHPAGTRVYLQNATLDLSQCTARLYVAHGYAPTQHQFRMEIELEDSAAADLPPDVGIRLYREPEERGTLHSVLGDAFGGRQYPFADWSRRVLDNAGFDATLCWVAVEGDAVVGAIVCFWKRYGDWGWIESLGVLPDRRGRGLGEALLRTAFAEFFRRGERRVALGVSADNPTGATRLYERLGMKIRYQIVLYEKELRAG